MDEVTFREHLELCGVELDYHKDALIEQGFRDLKTVAESEDSEIKDLVTYIARNVLDDDGDRIIISFVAIKKLRTYRLFAHYWQLQGKSLDVLHFDEAGLLWGLNRMDDHNRAINTAVVSPKPPSVLRDLLKGWIS